MTKSRSGTRNDLSFAGARCPVSVSIGGFELTSRPKIGKNRARNQNTSKYGIEHWLFEVGPSYVTLTRLSHKPRPIAKCTQCIGFSYNPCLIVDILQEIEVNNSIATSM